MSTYPRVGGKRAAFDLAIAFMIGLILALLNLAVNFNDTIHEFITEHEQTRTLSLVVNVLFLWLVLLLWFAFRRWRDTLRRSVEMEDVVSSINPDGLIVVDPDRRIVLCNTAVKRMFGYAMEEIVGQKTDILYGDRRTNPNVPHEIYDAMKRDGFHVGLARGRKKDGTMVPLEIISGELRTRGGAVLLLRDMSEKVRTEERHREMEARMQQSQKLETLGLLAGGIAHDFNNLLMVVSGNVDLAMMQVDRESTVAKNLREIQTAAQRAAEMCTEMLAYTGKGKFTVQPLNLSDVVQEMGHFLEIAISKKAELRYNLATDLPSAEGDVAQIRQIVINLLTNASDAIGKDDGVISISTGVQKLDQQLVPDDFGTELPSPGEYVYVAVRDTGCGMDVRTKEQIFEPFFTTKFTGRGLGLASVRGIMRSHRGALKVESVPGKGSTFTAYFPVCRKPAVEEQALVPDDAWRGKGLALVVEDEEKVRNLVSRMLEKLGFSIVSAVDGQQGVDLFRQHADRLKFVLLDMTMPRMSGVEAYREMRKVKPDVPVIFCSGYTEEAAAASELGENTFFVQKPYDRAVLARRVREALEA